jgi:hypothetical protein
MRQCSAHVVSSQRLHTGCKRCSTSHKRRGFPHLAYNSRTEHGVELVAIEPAPQRLNALGLVDNTACISKVKLLNIQSSYKLLHLPCNVQVPSTWLPLVQTVTEKFQGAYRGDLVGVYLRGSVPQVGYRVTNKYHGCGNAVLLLMQSSADGSFNALLCVDPEVHHRVMQQGKNQPCNAAADTALCIFCTVPCMIAA